MLALTDTLMTEPTKPYLYPNGGVHSQLFPLNNYEQKFTKKMTKIFS